jgi:hypothetical protein
MERLTKFTCQFNHALMAEIWIFVLRGMNAYGIGIICIEQD